MQTHEAYQNRPKSGEQEGRYRRGVGVAFGQWFYFYDPDTMVRLETSADGFTVKMATQDIGNGVKTSLARIVAEAFGIRPEAVNIEVGSSELPHGPSAAGSRVTASVYAPTEEASVLMRDRLFGLIAEEFELENAWFEDGGIKHKDGMLTWEEALGKIPPQQVEIKRGGDIMDRRRHHVSTGDIIDISKISGYDKITKTDEGGYRIGAQVKLDTIANDKNLIEHYPGLAMATRYSFWQ